MQENVCPAGCKADIVSVHLSGASGSEIILTSCSGCDRRYWRRDGQLVQLIELLDELSPAAMRRAS